jgi:glycerol-3-phosphate acyltransferase PlsY
MLPALAIVLAYLLGSIPFGYLIVKLSGGGDVRAGGSGGTGATNVTRRAGKGAGVLTLLLDAAKGALAVVLARAWLTPNFGINWWVAAVALAVIVGHCFPVWLRFRGGKGVATGLGVFLVLAPWAVVVIAVVFLLVVWQTRYVSLGSIIAALLMPLLVALFSYRARQTISLAPLLAVACAGGALIIFMHRANIKRLLHGTENQLK